MKTSTTDKDKLKEGYEKFDFYYILIKYIQLLNPIFIYKSIHVKQVVIKNNLSNKCFQIFWRFIS
jgi:hypothetical protein